MFISQARHVPVESEGSMIPDTTAIDAAAGEVIRYVGENKPVFFVAQHGISKERCDRLTKEYEGAEFVAFNQKNLGDLPGLLGDSRYEGRPKAFITFGLEYDKIKPVIENSQNIRLFSDVMPFNFADEDIPGLGKDKSFFQKRVLTVAMLARALPKEGYRETYGYQVLKNVLDMQLPEGVDAEDYIQHLFDESVAQRFGYIINNMLKPIIPADIERLKHAVEVFISA